MKTVRNYLAYAKAKFKYAYNQRCYTCKDFLGSDIKMYGTDETHSREKLSTDKICQRKNSNETTKIIEMIRTELYKLLPPNSDGSRSELMESVLNYLKKF